MSAAGLLRGRFLCCEVGLGLRGGGRILKGGGRGEGLEEGGFIGVLSYLCCVVSLLFCLCVFFIISKTGILSFYLKKRICQTRICHKPYRICHIKWN